MIEATSFFHDQSHDLWVSEAIFTAWKSESEVALTDYETEFAETDKSIFLSTALTALQRKWCKIISTDFARTTLIVKELKIERTSTEIAAKNSENNWSVNEFFILMRLDFSENILSFFLLISILINIMIKSVSQLYSW